MRKNVNFGQQIKSMAKICGRDVLPEVRMPRKGKGRGKDKGPRNLVEKQLRKEVIKWLKSHGWRVWRIENSISGNSSGIADLLIAKDRMIFVELKGTSGLTGLQPEFAEYCKRCNMPYYIIRKVEELCQLG